MNTEQVETIVKKIQGNKPLSKEEFVLAVEAIRNYNKKVEPYIEYGETSVKLGLLIVAMGLGAAAAVFGLSLAIYVSLKMLGLR